VEQADYQVDLGPNPEGGYVAVVPASPGCCSQGETAEEAVSNAHEARHGATVDATVGSEGRRFPRDTVENDVIPSGLIELSSDAKRDPAGIRESARSETSCVLVSTDGPRTLSRRPTRRAMRR
jgi:predicted RNase H-like HicB family nuclease